MNEQIEWKGAEFQVLAFEETVKAMKKACIFVQRYAKQTVGGPGSGRAYKRGKGKGKAARYHYASVPGAPPARDSGVLTSSISYKIDKKGAYIQGRVGPDVAKIASRKKGSTDPEYGLYLELGTKRMAARPWLSLTQNETSDDVIRIFQNAFK